MKAERLTHEPRCIPGRLNKQPAPRIRLAEGRLTTVRHSQYATRTSQTAHPQLHAGSLAAHPADWCLSLHRLVLACVCKDTPR